MSEKIDKYNCPICQCVLKEPVMTTKCFHTFCLKCIKTYINSKMKRNGNNNNKFNCPLCRQELMNNDYVLAYDLQKEIENCKIKCEKCKIDISLNIFEEHQENCESRNKLNDGTVLGDYNCTLCSKEHMSRNEYVCHIEDKHTYEEGVCAICSVQPWGDKNYKTYLLGHVNYRHKNKDISQKDENKEELELVRQVMLNSLIEI